MKKYIRAVESIFHYDYDDAADICKPKALMYFSAIRPINLENIQKNFKIQRNLTRLGSSIVLIMIYWDFT